MTCVRQQGIHARIRLRGLVIVLRLAVFLLNRVIKLHCHRAIRTVTSRKFVSPNQIIDCIDKYGDGN